MNLQWIIVIILIILAFAYVGIRIYKQVTGKKSACNCCPYSDGGPCHCNENPILKKEKEEVANPTAATKEEKK